MMRIEYTSMFTLSNMAQEKQNVYKMSTNFSQVLEDYPIRNFCHLGGCCLWNVFREPPCVGVSGQESSKRVWKEWWGADVCEKTRHAQPDTTHRHHSQDRALDGEQQGIRHRAGSWAEGEFCLGPSQRLSSRLVYLCVVPEPPQIGGFHIHQPRSPFCHRCWCLDHGSERSLVIRHQGIRQQETYLHGDAAKPRCTIALSSLTCKERWVCSFVITYCRTHTKVGNWSTGLPHTGEAAGSGRIKGQWWGIVTWRRSRASDPPIIRRGESNLPWHGGETECYCPSIAWSIVCREDTWSRHQSPIILKG